MRFEYNAIQHKTLAMTVFSSLMKLYCCCVFICIVGKKFHRDGASFHGFTYLYVWNTMDICVYVGRGISILWSVIDSTLNIYVFYMTYTYYQFLWYVICGDDKWFSRLCLLMFHTHFSWFYRRIHSANSGHRGQTCVAKKFENYASF